MLHGTSSDPTFPKIPPTGLDGGTWQGTFTAAQNGTFDVSWIQANDPISNVPGYGFGHTVQNGTKVVTTNYSQEGSIAADFYTNTVIMQATFECTKGKLATTGTWNSIYTYALPLGSPGPPAQSPGIKGPFYGNGLSTSVPCKK
jgi:hypothetical protein